jgi:hypothetical protein
MTVENEKLEQALKAAQGRGYNYTHYKTSTVLALLSERAKFIQALELNREKWTQRECLCDPKRPETLCNRCSSLAAIDEALGTKTEEKL